MLLLHFMTEKSKLPVGEVIWPLMAEFVRGRSWDANLTPNAQSLYAQEWIAANKSRFPRSQFSYPLSL